MNSTAPLLPALLGGLPLAVLYSLLLITLRSRFGGIGLLVGAVVPVLALSGFVAPQAFHAEQDHPLFVSAFVVILFVAVFGIPAVVLWRARSTQPSLAKQVLYGVLGFYGGILVGVVAAFLLLFVAQSSVGRAV